MIKNPPTKVYRLAYSPEPWAPNPTPKFEGRFDDPEHRYSVLYASSARLGCFLECLANFRPASLPGLTDVRYADDSYTFPPGRIPPFWLAKRVIGRASLLGNFADIGCADWIDRLRRNQKAQTAFQTCALAELNQASLYASSCRFFTQAVSRIVYQEESRLDGIRFESRLGVEIENWAIFYGRATLVSDANAPLDEDDPDLLAACQLLNVALASGAGSR